MDHSGVHSGNVINEWPLRDISFWVVFTCVEREREKVLLLWTAKSLTRMLPRVFLNLLPHTKVLSEQKKKRYFKWCYMKLVSFKVSHDWEILFYFHSFCCLAVGISPCWAQLSGCFSDTIVRESSAGSSFSRQSVFFFIWIERREDQESSLPGKEALWPLAWYELKSGCAAFLSLSGKVIRCRVVFFFRKGSLVVFFFICYKSTQKEENYFFFSFLHLLICISWIVLARINFERVSFNGGGSGKLPSPPANPLEIINHTERRRWRPLRF